MKNILSKAFILLFCSWINCFSYILADNTNFYFHQWTIDKGLSQATVTSILSGSDGMMWIGTRSGLNLFDRHELRSFFYDKENPFSIPGNFIHFITEDDSGTVWISTNNGLVRYSRKEDAFFPAISGKATKAYSFYSTQGAMYFGGENVVYKYIPRQQKWECYPIHTGFSYPFYINFIIPSEKDNLLLISSDLQIFRFNTHTQLFSKDNFPGEPSIISSLYQDREGNLYISPHREGLFCYDRNRKLKYHLHTGNSALTNDIILSMIEKDGKLWLATDGGGINILDTKNLIIESIRHIPGDVNSMPVNSITCLYKDPQDNVFAGSVRGGMLGFKKVSIKTYRDVTLNCPYGLSERAVISLYEDNDGILWIGTDGGGVNRYDPTSDSFTHYTSLKLGKVVAITSYSDSELLISLYNDRPYIFNKKTGKCTPFEIINPHITHEQCEKDFTEMAFRLSEKKIYFLSSVPYIYNTEKHTFSELTTKESPSYLQALNPIFADEKEAYFIQYRSNRLFKVDQENGTLSTMLCIGEKETIRAACRDNKGIFWIGTDAGLSYYNPQTNELKKLETELFNNVSTILYDGDKRLWIGAQNLLFSYNLHTEKFVIWGESDGFSLNEIPYSYQTAPKRNHIYLGGVAGLVRINRDIPSDDDPLPRIKLMDVIIDGNSLLDKLTTKTTEISVPWNFSSLVVKVLSIEKDIFRKKLFRYTISGPNKLYTVTYNHTLTLQTLPPGEYYIEVSCNAKNGDWSVQQKVLHIVVTPPWYNDPMIRFITLLLTGGLIAGGIWGFLRRKERKMKWEMSVHEQKINEDKVRFLINISHELRTPLTLAYAPLKRILDRREWELPENNTYEKLLNVFRQVCHMKDLINMVLDLNKINDKENVINKTCQSINCWIETVTEDFVLELKEKQIRLVFDLDTANPIVCFDSLKCVSVLSNLLMNALKFSEARTTITISSRIIENVVRISVADQGIGLDHTEIDKLFMLYYQGNHNKTGTGIGLSYAKTLMEKHKGTLGATNNNPQGAIFYFEFPYQPDLTIDLSHKVEHTIKNTIPSHVKTKNEIKEAFPFAHCSAMVVEDNNELCDFIKQTLQDLFKHVYTASNGSEALAIIAEKLPDVVISDVMMPQMDGFKMCRKIKENITTSHIPVILLTARGDTGSMNTGYKLGADTYLSKPFEEELLITVIVNQLKNRETLKKKYRECAFSLSSQSVTANNLDEEFLLKLNKLINDNIGLKTLDVKFLTNHMGMSRTPLFTKLKALTNMGINDYVTMIRIEQSSNLLTTTSMSIAEVAETVGFDSPKYFSTLFKQIKEMTPTQFREAGNKG